MYNRKGLITAISHLGKMTRCRNARKYKGMRPPTCGCDMCIIKFEVAQMKLSLEAKISKIDDKLLQDYI